MKPSEPVESPVQVSQPVQLDEVGQLLVDAHNASQEAKSITDFSTIIGQCVEALRLGATAENKQFAKRLLSWSLNRRGQLYSEEAQQGLADADFNESLEFNPNNWRALHNRGVSSAEGGRFAEAFDDFNRVLDMNPQFAKAYTNRATLFVQANDWASGERLPTSVSAGQAIAVAPLGTGSAVSFERTLGRGLSAFLGRREAGSGEPGHSVQPRRFARRHGSLRRCPGGLRLGD